jgi:hypothetical protein
MSREIKLTRGKRTVVDDEDYEALKRRRWHYMPPSKASPGGSGYAVCSYRGSTLYMHQLLTLLPPRQLEVDHINGDGLDNRRENLRVVSHQKNLRNRHRVSTNNKTSGVDGVCFDRSAGSWRAYIDRGGRIYLGRHATKEAAMKARQAAEARLDS